jgi:leader peptidase (prepilin peptidase) / N-methyltransferase
MPLALAPAALLGLVIGSFLNVVAWRLPRGESLSRPGSHCPGCQAPVKPYDNVPVLSWLLLRGRCRSCHTSISARYPVVEAGTGALYALVVALLWEDPAQVALGLALVTFLVPIALIDAGTKRIPNKLTLPAALVAVALGTALDPGGQPERLLAGLGACLAFGLPAFLNPRGMGMGDAKLAGVLGLFLGLAVVPALALGVVLGTVVGVAIIARKGMTAGRRTAIPFGPFLAAGAVIALFAGEGLMDGYLSTF